MARKCESSGKTVHFGNRITRRGLPKYKGGIGLKTTGINRRKFKPNLQNIKVLFPDGSSRVMKLATSVIRTGRIKIMQGGKQVEIPLVKAVAKRPRHNAPRSAEVK